METSNTGEVVGLRIFGGKIAPVGGHQACHITFQKDGGQIFILYPGSKRRHRVVGMSPNRGVVLETRPLPGRAPQLVNFFEKNNTFFTIA